MELKLESCSRSRSRSVVIDVDVDANATSCYDNNNATTNARCAKMKLCCNLQWALEMGIGCIMRRDTRIKNIY